MHRECLERFPRHGLQRKPLVSDPGMHHDTCVMHVTWCMSGLLTRSGGENVCGIPAARATRKFTYRVRGPYARNLAMSIMALRTPTRDCLYGTNKGVGHEMPYQAFLNYVKINVRTRKQLVSNASFDEIYIQIIYLYICWMETIDHGPYWNTNHVLNTNISLFSSRLPKVIWCITHIGKRFYLCLCICLTSEVTL